MTFQISKVNKLNIDLPQEDHCFANKMIINEFQKLADSYRARRDKWRILGYEKAIQSIKSLKKEITNVDVSPIFLPFSSLDFHVSFSHRM